MIVVSTAESHTFGKSYSVISAENLEELKTKLLEAGNTEVSLISANNWDDRWSTHKTIAVVDLSEKDLAWINRERRTEHSNQRHLRCKS